MRAAGSSHLHSVKPVDFQSMLIVVHNSMGKAKDIDLIDYV